jgi:hypothetical protein
MQIKTLQSSSAFLCSARNCTFVDQSSIAMCFSGASGQSQLSMPVVPIADLDRASGESPILGDPAHGARRSNVFKAIFWRDLLRYPV